MLTCLPIGLSVEGDDDSLGSFLRLIMRLSWLTFPQAQSSITIPRGNGRTVEDITQDVFFKFEFRFSRYGGQGGLAGCWERWIRPLCDCSSLFGTPKHYYYFLASHGNYSPATNHLLLPDDTEIESCYWNIFHPDARSADRRGLQVYISSFVVTHWRQPEARRCSFLQYYMLAPVCGCDFLSPSFPASFHLTNMLIG